MAIGGERKRRRRRRVKGEKYRLRREGEEVMRRWLELKKKKKLYVKRKERSKGQNFRGKWKRREKAKLGKKMRRKLEKKYK